jgi:hypothetical protein
VSPRGASRDAAGDFQRLAAELTERFGGGIDEPWDDFEPVALRVFAHQYATNPPYRAFARGRDRTPATVQHWHDIPAVPASAFKHLALISGERGDVERVFRTSGTTAEGAGAHHVLSLALYRAACLPNLSAHLVPEKERLRLLSLVPDARVQPDSSLATMMGFALDELAAPGSGIFVQPGTGVDVPAFRAALTGAVSEGAPVWVAGTAFAFVHWLDDARRDGFRVRLPAGSRLMETGGFKGRSREVPRAELYEGIEACLGIPPKRMVNEYGMTELLSQFYEPVLRVGGAAGDAGSAQLENRRHVAPPWVRTRVLDPETLEPCAPGVPGLLCHLDLANAGSVAAVLTADLGVADEGGFRVLGRAPGAEPRGCSLALEELLEAHGS